MDMKKLQKVLDNFHLLEHGVTQSTLKTFMLCRRKWLWELAGYSSPKINYNTFFGSLVHELLDICYTNGKTTQSLDRDGLLRLLEKEALKWVDANPDQSESMTTNYLETEISLAVVMVTEYFQFYIQDFDNWEEIYPEEEFGEIYKGKTLLRGKIDGIVVNTAGEYWQLEHKTKTQINEESLLRQLTFDLQNLMYSMVLRKLKKVPIKGTIYNIIRKPGLRRGAKESMGQFSLRVGLDVSKRREHYFKRYEVIYSDSDFAKFEVLLDQILDELGKFLRGELLPYANLGSCFSPWACPFSKLCMEGDPEGLLIRKTLHPELEEVNMSTFSEIADIFKDEKLVTKPPKKKLKVVKRIKKKLNKD